MVNMIKNFNHPNIPAGHELRGHVLYKITKSPWINIKI